MADYESSIAAAAVGGADAGGVSAGHRVLHFPPGERINNLMYDGLLPSTQHGGNSTSNSCMSSSTYAYLGSSFPLCGALSGHREGTGPPPAAELRHPLELQLRQHLRKREQQQLRRAAAVSGLHAPLRLKMERELCAMTQRLPGLPSSMWGLQILMNLDDEVSIEDYMGRDKPEEDDGECNGALGVHGRIEKRFGLL